MILDLILQTDVNEAIAWLPLAVAGSGLLSSVGSLFGQRSANRSNIQLAREARAWDLKMWEKQNEYNLPQNQMARLQSAGLNPNLAYGSGNVSGNVIGQAPRSPVPRVENVINSDLGQVAQSALMAYNQTRLANIEIDKRKADIEYTQAKTNTESVNALLKSYLATGAEKKLTTYDYSNKILSAKAQYADAKNQYEAENLKMLGKLRKQQLQLNPQRMALQGLDIALKNIELQLNSKLKTRGLTQSDPYLLRMFFTAFGGDDDSEIPKQEDVKNNFWYGRTMPSR